MVSALDESIGNITRALKQAGLLENTLIGESAEKTQNITFVQFSVRLDLTYCPRYNVWKISIFMAIKPNTKMLEYFPINFIYSKVLSLLYFLFLFV